ncbi:CGA synthase-related protein [Streptomyces hesseae]|uniref:CGA synthase-related protein n=1 Tax=Streptomyces hesseae TaxID=3075519 RepID=A0ABU2SFE5_9ACTN|nr:CGA synthase-related protein [Streptomyces sp. DSM 40473]MDT0447592.1 CGA synthase-related protein [Streptomyces sp. DSM 40473]
MELLTPGRRPGPPDPAAPYRRVLLVSRDDELDSVLARRRVAAHLGGLRSVPLAPGGPPPDAALVCDDERATARLLALGVPVVHLRSGHDPGPGPATGDDGRALRRLHRPGWLPGPRPAGARTTGVLAPARLTRDRDRAGTLLLLSLWGVPDEEAGAFAAGPLRTLVHEAEHRTGRCEVVCDGRLAAVRAGLGGARPVRAAAEVDVDALHAAAEVFLASPTTGALALAHARGAPLCFLPPLGAAQRDLAERVGRVVPVPRVSDPADPSVWTAPGAGPHGLWDAVDPGLDDLRGAQRVARTLRQLALAPL